VTLFDCDFLPYLTADRFITYCESTLQSKINIRRGEVVILILTSSNSFIFTGTSSQTVLDYNDITKANSIHFDMSNLLTGWVYVFGKGGIHDLYFLLS
jgi:hypothetical protein